MPSFQGVDCDVPCWINLADLQLYSPESSHGCRLGGARRKCVWDLVDRREAADPEGHFG